MNCPVCFQPMDKICYECGAFYDIQEYQVYDLYNYTPTTKRRYNRLDHFKEVLNQLQGKEGRVIPPDVIQTIKNEINNIPVGRCMTIKQALRKLKLTKYVENTNYLEYIINRKQLLFIPKLLEDKLIRYFKQIDRTFDSLYTNQSFMSYSYVIYKLLQTMGEHELMSHIQLLKTKTRILQHDRVWQKICEELGWHYVSTLN